MWSHAGTRVGERATSLAGWGMGSRWPMLQALRLSSHGSQTLYQCAGSRPKRPGSRGHYLLLSPLAVAGPGRDSGYRSDVDDLTILEGPGTCATGSSHTSGPLLSRTGRDDSCPCSCAFFGRFSGASWKVLLCGDAAFVSLLRRLLAATAVRVISPISTSCLSAASAKIKASLRKDGLYACPQ